MKFIRFYWLVLWFAFWAPLPCFAGRGGTEIIPVGFYLGAKTGTMIFLNHGFDPPFCLSTEAGFYLANFSFQGRFIGSFDVGVEDAKKNFFVGEFDLKYNAFDDGSWQPYLLAGVGFYSPQLNRVASLGGVGLTYTIGTGVEYYWNSYNALTLGIGYRGLGGKDGTTQALDLSLGYSRYF